MLKVMSWNLCADISTLDSNGERMDKSGVAALRGRLEMIHADTVSVARFMGRRYIWSWSYCRFVADSWNQLDPTWSSWANPTWPTGYVREVK